MSPDADAVSSAERVVRRLFLLVPIAGLLSLAVLGLYFYQFVGPLSAEKQEWGLFGDYVGGALNPFFGFLALIALLWTIALQAKELRLSTVQLQRSAEALDAQNETLRIQSFEATFFQLLRLHNDIVNAVDLFNPKDGQLTKGRDCFRVFRKRLHGVIDQHGGIDDLKAMRAGYESFFSEHQAELGHYFRLLYNIVKFVDRSHVPDKRLYTNLVRAQLSSDELVLLFFNCLTRWGEEKFKPLVERYSLLKTLPPGAFPSDALRQHYSQSAYDSTAPR